MGLTINCFAFLDVTH
jgi:hypothetical protein